MLMTRPFWRSRSRWRRSDHRGYLIEQERENAFVNGLVGSETWKRREKEGEMIAIGAGWEKGEAVRRWGKKSLASYEADLLGCLYQDLLVLYRIHDDGGDW
jgi:hypothetical protein